MIALLYNNKSIIVQDRIYGARPGQGAVPGAIRVGAPSGDGVAVNGWRRLDLVGGIRRLVARRVFVGVGARCRGKMNLQISN